MSPTVVWIEKVTKTPAAEQFQVLTSVYYSRSFRGFFFVLCVLLCTCSRQWHRQQDSKFQLFIFKIYIFITYMRYTKIWLLFNVQPSPFLKISTRTQCWQSINTLWRISLHVMYVYQTKVPSTCIPFRLKTQKFLSINFFSKVIRLLNTEANACAVHARNVSFPKFAAAVNLHCTSINFELIIN